MDAGEHRPRVELARLSLLREEIEHFASWAAGASRAAADGSATPETAGHCAVQPSPTPGAPTFQGSGTGFTPDQKPVRSSAFGWSFNRR